MSATTCDYTVDDVLAFAAGDLDPEGALAAAEHVGECRSCRDAAAEFRELRELVPAACSRSALGWHRFPTPFGPMHVAATDRGLARLSWQQPDDDAFVGELEDRFPDRVVVRRPEALAAIERQLREYFAGERASFDLPVDLGELSPFQRRVLEAARRLDHGQVVPYAELARRIGRPKAYRAVGNALGKNPVAIVVPCHRVVRSDGGLGGYGGGVEYKEALLRLEGRGDLLQAAAG